MARFVVVNRNHHARLKHPSLRTTIRPLACRPADELILKRKEDLRGSCTSSSLIAVFGRNHALEFERVDGAEDRRQIKTLPSVGNHPVDLHHAGQNRLAGKMAVKIKQVIAAR